MNKLQAVLVNIVEWLGKAAEWLVKSSADATKMSLAVKSFLGLMVPFIVATSGLMHVQVSSEALTIVIDSIAQFIVVVGGVITGLGMAWGILRKIWLTIIGENDVVAGWQG